MSKMSKIAILAAIATSIAAPALAQTPFYDAYYSSSYQRPGAPYSYSNLPAATGGGSLGYNYQVLHDDW